MGPVLQGSAVHVNKNVILIFIIAVDCPSVPNEVLYEVAVK